METNTDKSEQVAGNTDKQTAKERGATVEDTEEDESTVEVQWRSNFPFVANLSSIRKHVKHVKD